MDDLGELVDAARRFADGAYAANTRRGYESDLRAFARWCEGRGLASLPADPGVVALYLTALAGTGRKLGTVERAYTAIGWAHRTRGMAWQASPALHSVLAGIRRQLGRSTAKKAPLIDADLAALVGLLGNDLIEVRDRALLTLGWFGAFRRSEVVALRVDDVSFVAEGMIVCVRRSKTDQAGAGAEKGIPTASDARLCAVRSLRAWLELADITAGPLFRRVDRHGYLGANPLSGQAVADIVKRTAERAGLEPERFAGHSLRAGFITTAAARGKGLDAIMRQSLHRSERVARGYIRHATLFVDNAADGLL